MLEIRQKGPRLQLGDLLGNQLELRGELGALRLVLLDDFRLRLGKITRVGELLVKLGDVFLELLAFLGKASALSLEIDEALEVAVNLAARDERGVGRRGFSASAETSATFTRASDTISSCCSLMAETTSTGAFTVMASSCFGEMP